MDTRDLNNTADQYLRNGQLPEALEAYTRLCELKPQSAQAWHKRAVIHGMLGEFRHAVRCYEKALALRPDSAVLHNNHANALTELGLHQDAIRAFQNAIALDPANIDSHIQLGCLHRLLNNLSEAESCFRSALKTRPNSIEAASRLAHLLKYSGSITEAIETCEKALSLEPGNRSLFTTLLECYFLDGQLEKAYQHIIASQPIIPDISKPLYRVSKLFHDQGLYQKEAAALQTILKVFPEDDFFKLLLADCQIKQNLISDASHTLEQVSDNDITLEARVMLIDAYQNTGQADKADYQLMETVRKFPDNEIPVGLLCRNLVQSEKYAEARSLLEDFLEKHPESYRILVELGKIHELEEDLALAEERYKQAISVNPSYAFAHNSLGALYRIRIQDSLAKQYFQNAIRCDPDLLAAKCNLADLYLSNGDYAKAETCYNEILETDPDLEAAIAGKSSVLERIGKVAESLQLVKPFIQRGTSNIQTLVAYGRASRIVNEEAKAVELLKQTLDHEDIPTHDRMQGYFLLGKLLDRLGHFDQAFDYYRRGNELNQFSFDRDAHLRFADSLQSVFTSGNMAVFPRSTNKTDKPVFIIGMPRSGTTLTEQILASHPDIFGAGELPHIRNIAARIQGAAGAKQAFPLYMPVVTRELLDRFSFEYLQTVESLSSSARRVTDKMPSNFMFLGLIELLFPKARVIHCVREPLDTCLSCYFQNFYRGQHFSYKQTDLAFFYKQYRQIMSHWKSVLSIPIMEVKYEHLVDDQERISRKILEFLGLDWHPGCLDFHKSDRNIRTASYDQVRNPVYSSSINRWKKYENHLTELIRSLSE